LRTSTASGNACEEEGSQNPEEREIPGYVANEDSNNEIARSLDLAEITVKIHVQYILRKANLSSRVQAAVCAIEHGLASS
jgi:two-component system nitrate/nitrite response regulator NarL